MKMLITGGAGFIGSAVIRYIISNTSDSVVNVDVLTYASNLDALSAVKASEKYVFEKVDIGNRGELKRVFLQHQPDAVMHLAAESHVDRSIDGPSAFIETNLVGTFNLLEVSREYYFTLDPDKKKNFRFHHISTDEVYGELSEGVGLFTEEASYLPSSPYAATKAGSDHLVRAWGRTYGLPIMVSHCSNNYGPFQFPEKLIPHVILNALKGKPIPVYGDGRQSRDWLYVEDHARALYLVLTKGQAGETYNIGGHNERQNIDVVIAICALLDGCTLNKPNGLNSYLDLVSYVSDRPGHDRRYAIDASKIQRELGWRAEEDFNSGLRKTVLWYLENESWWQRMLSKDYQLTRLGGSK